MSDHLLRLAKVLLENEAQLLPPYTSSFLSRELQSLVRDLEAAPAPARRTITREEFDNAVRQMQYLTTNYPDGVRKIAAAWRLTVEDA